MKVQEIEMVSNKPQVSNRELMMSNALRVCDFSVFCLLFPFVPTPFCHGRSFLHAYYSHVLGQKYSVAVDWWAYGVLVYEMMKTTTPFFHEKGRRAIFQAILKSDPSFPMHFSAPAQVYIFMAWYTCSAYSLYCVCVCFFFFLFVLLLLFLPLCLVGLNSFHASHFGCYLLSSPPPRFILAYFYTGGTTHPVLFLSAHPSSLRAHALTRTALAAS